MSVNCNGLQLELQWEEIEMSHEWKIAANTKLRKKLEKGSRQTCLFCVVHSWAAQPRQQAATNRTFLGSWNKPLYESILKLGSALMIYLSHSASHPFESTYSKTKETHHFYTPPSPTWSMPMKAPSHLFVDKHCRSNVVCAGTLILIVIAKTLQ